MRILMVVAFGALLGGPALAGQTLSALPAAGQSFGYMEGKPILSSEAAASGAAIALDATVEIEGRGPFLTLIVQNRTDAPVNLGPDSIVVSTDQGKPVAVLDDAALMADARRRAKGQAGWARFGAAMGALGGASASKSAYANQVALNERLARIGEERAHAEQGAALLGFKPHTVAPGQSYVTGLPLPKLPRGVEGLSVQVRFGQDVHQFAFAVR